jgi:hypothetical protein
VDDAGRGWPATTQWDGHPRATLKSEGLITGFGLSVNRWEPTDCFKALDTGLVDVIQVIYNIFDHAPEDDLFPRALSEGIGIIARVPYDEGGLTGSLRADTQFSPEDWRAVHFGPENLLPTVERAERLRADVPPGIDHGRTSAALHLGAPCRLDGDPGDASPGTRPGQHGRVRRQPARSRAVVHAAQAPLGPGSHPLVHVAFARSAAGGGVVSRAVAH